MIREVDGVLELVRLDVQRMVPNGSDRPIEISDDRPPLRPLVRVLVRVFPIPERIQRVQSPRKQRDVREIATLVELFRGAAN